MFLTADILKLRHDQEFFVEKFVTMTIKMKQENPDMTEEECVYATAVMLSYVIHDTKELTMEEMQTSVESLINRFVDNAKA